LDPKEGLALVNGDNFSTAYAAFIIHRLIEYFLIGEVVGAMAIEVLKGSTRSFHPMLAAVRPHAGQKESADTYRYLLEGSQLAYQELSGHQPRTDGIKVQDGYSLRSLSQFEAVMIEKLKWALDVITVNANSVSDNPLWVPEEFATKGEEPWQWVSGGNFLAMHMAEVMDNMRKIITQMVKRNDRHLARMIDMTENNGLGPNLSSSKSITRCTFKGIQIQSGMLEIYSMILANPVTTLFGMHEERNQDITSHAITSGILALKNLELLNYSLVSNLLAVAQGVDLRGGPELLSPKTRPMYEFIRLHSNKVTEDRPLFGDLQKLSATLDDGSMMKVVREKIFNKI
jgi:histidine ammonia-lyase